MLRAFVITVMLAFALTAQAEAQPGKKGDKPAHPGAPPAAREVGKGGAGKSPAEVLFSEVEKRLIREFFAKGRGKDDREGAKAKGKGGYKVKSKGKSKTLPPGLAKRETLPPGLQMQIQRFGTLPPGLAKRDLPPELEARLPRRRAGLVRKIVGNDVVLIEQATGLVLDILEGVLAK